MKTKIFIHKLLAMGTVAALGLCMGGTALAGAKTYSNNDIIFLIQPKDAGGGNITLESLGFLAVPSNNANANKDTQPGPPAAAIIDLSDNDAGALDAEACVGILPGNLDCKAAKPNSFLQQPIVADSDFCRGKAEIPFIPPLDDPNLAVEDGAQAMATSECQFDRENQGQGQSGIQFSASIVVEDAEADSTLTFEILAKPFLEAFCHNDPDFIPNATAASSVTIALVDDSTDAQIFAFNPDGVLNVAAGESVDEATLNTSRFCDTKGDVKMYDPFNPPVAGVNDCTGNDPAFCEYSATSPPLPAGNYTMVVAVGQDSNANKVPDDIPLNGDHFLCYKSFGKFLREEVNLVDQFDTDEGINFDVLKPKMFCNPAIKPELDPEAMLESGPHYLSYKINEAHREPRHERKMAEVQNQFGTMIVETFKPDRLMVPSGKSLDLAVPPAIPAPGPNTNHYKCYTVRATGFQSPGDVAVLDQFTDDDGKKLGIVRPTRLCNPVKKTRSDGTMTPIIEDPDNELDHLMCYSVRAGAGEKLHKKTKVLSNNQFREEELVLKRELEFCVPTKKTLLTP